MGNILWIIIGGAIIGIVARLVMPGRQNIPWWLTIIVGIVGMFIGDWIAGLLGVKETGGFDWIRHGLQVVVAVLGIVAVGAITGRRSTSA
ncbi:MAG: GlsB/YeaQ/YmgE family stress response membrane protein [Actinobacteria bacterium]|jgi:uncharacterized membrane protein YeaQ/YmgE (transglycosylase-associated protein family)|nr:GlsB/YeaQ/YmgE family stress response membrane protein [Actinomycetota bacterium]